MYLVVGEDTVESFCDPNDSGTAKKIIALEEALAAVKELAETDDSQHFIVFEPVQVVYNSPNIQRDSGASFRKGLPVLGVDDDDLTVLVKTTKHANSRKKSK